jgi:hypothetical protein
VQKTWLGVLEGLEGRGDPTGGHPRLRLKLAHGHAVTSEPLSSPERDTSGLMNSRTTATKSSSGNSTVRRNSTMMVSCPGVSVTLS